MTSRALPYLLTPYLTLPSPGSLHLITSVLSATSNWLITRYLQALLPPRRSEETPTTPFASVVLVSFLRDFNFWTENAGKLGIDLTRHGREGNFVFVDGLTGLFLPGEHAKEKGRIILTSTKMSDVWKMIQESIASVTPSGRPVVLILDQLDAFLAITETSVTDIHNLILSLRESTHFVILTLSADEPLIFEQHTTLEESHASFTLEASHQADLILSLRNLDTGIAKDVSGVIRITRGGQESSGTPVEEHEYLYYVSGDGGVKVFERGQ